MTYIAADADVILSGGSNFDLCMLLIRFDTSFNRIRATQYADIFLRDAFVHVCKLSEIYRCSREHVDFRRDRYKKGIGERVILHVI